MFPDQIDTSKNFSKNGDVYYTVQPGDELWAVVTANNTTTRMIAKLNRIYPQSDLVPGKDIIIFKGSK
uniref:LysM peptidoglycan-binding domain-containing protein n=1 Tax=Lentilactobacillus hilgardii TaxID=1588 RepID=UPI00403EFB17